MVVYERWRKNVSGIRGSSSPEEMMVGLVPGEYFSLLRVQPAMGRLFTPQEVQPGRQFVAAISRSLWRCALQLRSAAFSARRYALTVRPTRLLPSCRISFPLDGTHRWPDPHLDSVFAS